jgi:hypothetical protein
MWLAIAALLPLVSTEEAEGAAEGEAAEEGQSQDDAEQRGRWSRLATDMSVGLGANGCFATDPAARIISLSPSVRKFHVSLPSSKHLHKSSP